MTLLSDVDTFTTGGGGNAGTVTSIGDLTGVVTSANRATAIADAALSIAKTIGLQTALDGKLSLTGGAVSGAVVLTSATNAGYVSFPTQSGTLATPGTGFNLFAGTTGKLTWKGTNGFLRTFDGTANTADRLYTLPDHSGTLLTDGNSHSGSLIAGGAFGAVNASNLTGTATAMSIGGNAATATALSLSGGGTVTGALGAITVTPLVNQSVTFATSGTSQVIVPVGSAPNGGAYTGGVQFGTEFALQSAITNGDIGLTRGNTFRIRLGAAGVAVRSNGLYAFSSGSDAVYNTADTAFSRISAGLLGLGTGALSSTAASLSLTNLTASGTLTVTGNAILPTSTTPASATATGVAGTVCRDSDYIYVCTATNTWKRVAISTW